MSRPMTTQQARAIAAQREHPGRRRGVEMPCGWKCGGKFTASEMREHFTTCPKRPAARPAR